ncbi:methionyl-tRNA formyltransferase [Novosphingopyxis iocasae]|uniref:methionyl-tRNA formyltransferase n=1 Tax=Novosphingopyxis iocasae TaxID=2762729 RepID=UPI001651A2E2|nr:methionyl-tRNA formyltransferase [Novosphingopyxis iocasae]|tara:strand:+ start:181 stop:405 length:225 start_codon:yes stop_codon:yes gene_type:complete
MATVRDFEIGDLDHVRPHDDVEAVVRLIECDGEKLIQIDTFGRSTREMPGKLSQSLRLDATAFHKLTKLGQEHF